MPPELYAGTGHDGHLTSDSGATKGKIYMGAATTVPFFDEDDGGKLKQGKLGSDLDCGAQTLTNAHDPATDQDVATKKYVDDQIAGAVGIGTVTKVTLTAAQAIDLAANPKVLIAAPGSGKATLFLGLWGKVKSTGHTVFAAGSNVQVKYETGPVVASGNVANTVIQSANDKTFLATPLDSTLSWVPNDNLVLGVSGADFTGGTGSTIDVYVHTVELTL